MIGEGRRNGREGGIEWSRRRTGKITRAGRRRRKGTVVVIVLVYVVICKQSLYHFTITNHYR